LSFQYIFVLDTGVMNRFGILYPHKVRMKVQLLLVALLEETKHKIVIFKQTYQIKNLSVRWHLLHTK